MMSLLDEAPSDFADFKYWLIKVAEMGVCFNFDNHCSDPLILDCKNCDAFMDAEMCTDIFYAGLRRAYHPLPKEKESKPPIIWPESEWPENKEEK
ncbi:hypothetical protein [uncultured Desulfosarcina sp.]|uniref:hypothetical protein n=1 Tax=uncultured Desulfosarcina sp. TaxID=218289 RepID=UPI0029C80BDC|nr:hypothetical protein [uncultured Desulfosarcina sp.]